MPGLIPIVCIMLQNYQKQILAVSLFHVFAVLVVLTHIHKPFIPLKQDRLMFESRGYKNLTNKLTNNSNCRTTSYQLAAMMELHNKQEQTPLCPPHNELSRISQFDLLDKSRIHDNDYLRMISRSPLRRKPLDFSLVKFDSLSICKNNTIYHDQVDLNNVQECDLSHRFFIYDFKKN